MPRKPTPWFPIYAAELLTDEKIEELSHNELGILLRLWSKMWINGTERGTLLREPGVPISDEKIADFLRLSVEEWEKTEARLVTQVKVLKRGEKGELFSGRLRNFKTKWELYGPEKESKKKHKRKITEKYLTTESSSSSSSSSEYNNISLQLKNFILQNNPKAKITDSQLKKWSDVVRLMVQRDGRTFKEIQDVIHWSQQDDFWKTNILSMGAVRRQFDRLTMQMKKGTEKKGTWRD